MVTTYELELFSKQAASSFLKDSTPLNESITKLATDHALNKEQIARVVEAANTEVYINLFNKSAEKYVQFDTADPVVIGNNITSTKVADVVDPADYYDAPAYEVPEYTPAIEKVAETKTPTSSDAKLKDYWRFKGAEAQLTGLLVEGQQLYNAEATVLQEMIKQAVLGGTPYNDIYNALNTNTDPIFTETLKAIENELIPNMPINSITKTATTLTNTVNSNHPLLQQSFKLVKIANEFKTINEKLKELDKEWEIYKVSGALGNTVSTMIKYPKTVLAAGLIGAGGTALALPAIARQSERQKNSPLNSVPFHYRG
jgi:hypothetical protein